MNDTNAPGGPEPDEENDSTENTLLGPPPSQKSATDSTQTSWRGTGGSDDPTSTSVPPDVHRNSSSTEDDDRTPASPAALDPSAKATRPATSGQTDLFRKPTDTAYAALFAPDQETFMPEESVGPPPPVFPVQGYPAVPGYEISGILGRGGMGVVYKAHHQGLRRLVALKMILHGDHASASDLARFRTEAEAIARLQHVNIVQIYAIGDFKGLPFFSLEFVEGGTLSRKIDGMPQPIAATAQMVESLARAMAFAHQRGIVHRDLKPANVLLTPDGTPKIVDFGLAKKLDELSEQTHSGAILGTPSYMAPEQAEGRTRDVGPATDIYALGSILYEMMTGRPPFRAEKPMDTILMVIQQEPVPPNRLNPKVPRDLETICLKCLQKEISKRYGSAEELADDLRRFREGDPIRARPITRTERALKWVRRRPALAAVYGLLLAVSLLGGLGIIFAWLWHEADLERQRELRAKQEVQTAWKSEQLARKGEADANEKLEQLSYIHRINLAWRDWNAGEVMRARRLVEGCAPGRRQWEWHYLKRQAFPELLNLPDNDDEPLQILFTPDGQRLLIVGKDGEIREWDMATQAEYKGPLEGTPVQYVAFRPDGALIAAAGTDQTISLVDVATGKTLRRLRGHQGAVRQLAFSPDGTRLASASADKTAMIWDVAGGKRLFTLEGHDDEVACVAFRPDGKQLATGSWDTTAKVWDSATGKQIVTPRITHEQALTQLVYSPDGKRLATACIDHTVKLWDCSTYEELPPLLGPMEDINQVAFSPDGGRIALAKKDKTLKVFDVVSGKQLFFLQGHFAEVSRVVYSSDGWRIASAGKDKTVKVWDATTGHETLTLQGTIDNVFDLAYCPANKRQVAACVEKTARIYDTDTGKELVVCRGHAEEVVHLAFDRSGSHLATASKDKTVKIWDAPTGMLLHTLKGHSGEVSQVVYSPDGKTLVSGGLNRTLKVWDAATGQELFSVDDLPGEVLHLAFRPDGRQVAVAVKKANVHVFDPHSGKLLFILPGLTDDVLFVVYNPSGTCLATGGRGRTAKLWDAVTGSEIVALAGHADDVVHLAFSPDGACLATASLDKTIRLWKASTGALLHTLEGHIGEVVEVAFSPDSERLASASWDRTVKVWDVATGKELLSLPGHLEEVTHVSFSPDGGEVASTSRGAIKIWESKDPGPAEAPQRRQLWRSEQAAGAYEGHRWFAAAFHLDRQLKHHPKDMALLQKRGRAYAEVGSWDKALGDFVAAEDLVNQALVHLAKKDQAGFRLAVERLVQDIVARMDDDKFRGVADLAILLPLSDKVSARLQQTAVTALALPRNAESEFTLGAILYRAGAFEEALQHLTQAAQTFGNDGTTETRLFLAMTQQRLKKFAQAQRWLVLAKEQIDQDAPSVEDPNASPISWQQRIRRDVLRQEAEKVLAGRD